MVKILEVLPVGKYLFKVNNKGKVIIKLFFDFEYIFGQWALIQPVFTCSKSIRTSEQCMKSIRS